MAGREEIAVFITRREATCGEYGEDLGRHAWIRLVEDKGALCLSCADLDHLVFLPAGDAALTRRAKKYSTLWAVVLEWSRTRKRYKRQGLLMEDKGLEQAEQECLADQDARQRKRERAAVRRAELDEAYVARFAARVREFFPRCPPGREDEIAEHACQKYSGRVGRSAAAKGLEEDAVRLAVVAHVRHAETDYDRLMAQGYDRWDARGMVAGAVDRLLDEWQAS